MSEYTMISAITLSNHGKNTLYYTQGTLLRKIKTRASLPSQASPTCPIFGGVDYKELNGSVTSTIYHMARNIGCIHR
jgi:hypothetical protein